jgi:hypothetical protein
MGKPMFMLWCLLFCGAGYYFFQKLDYVGMAGTAIIAVACFSGFQFGASRIAASLIGIAAAVALAPQLGMSQEHRFSEWFGTTGLVNRFLSIGVIGLLISLVASVAAVIIANRFIKNRPRLAKSNCWLGFVIGGAEAAIAVLLMLGGVLVMEPLERQRAELSRADEVPRFAVGPVITTVAMKTRASELGPVIDKYNPFVRFPQLNKIEKVQRTVGVLSDPAELHQLLHHPEIIKLQERPEVKRAVDRLMSDTEIKQILDSADTLSGEDAMTLLKHPAVLELIDQPGFLAEANAIIDQTELFSR